MKKYTDTPKTGNGLVQLIWMDGSTGKMWVNWSNKIMEAEQKKDNNDETTEAMRRDGQ